MRDPTEIEGLALSEPDADGYTPKVPGEAAAFKGRSIPDQRWLVPELLPAAQVGLFSGHGGAGKSTLMLQLAAATVLGRNWLSWMPNPGPALFITCEDDERSLHRRLAAIVEHHEVDWDELRHPNRLQYLTLAGEEAVLGQVSRSGLVRPTPLFEDIRRIAGRLRPSLITIDNAADVYAGSEIDRPQVRQFIAMLRRLALETGAHVLLSLHPSNAGLRDDTGLSGSTAWFNSVRSQLYLKTVKTEEGEEIDPDMRELEARKNQYGRLAQKVRLRWKDGLFLAEQDVLLGPMERAASAAFDDELFLDLLRKLASQGRLVGTATGTSYAPAIFAAVRKGITKKRFADAMERLLEARAIRVETDGPPSKRRSRLVIA